jgi:two-component system chemotaxis sensor kinase CheA
LNLLPEECALDDFEKELKVGFLDEAGQAVADVEQCFLSMEEKPDDAENLNKIFRLAHNLKGSSKAVGFDEFGAFTHQFESFILKVKNGELKATPKVVNLLLRANDHVMIMINGLKADLDAKFDSVALLAEMKDFSEDLAETPSAEATTESALIEAAQPEIIENLPEPMAPEVPVYMSVPTPAAPPVATSQPPIHLVPPASGAAPAPAPAKSKSNAASEESIRVALSKVETLINFVGEMVILQSVMREQAAASNSPLMRKTVHQIGKVGKEIQDIAMGLRMIPVKPTFQKMVRIVRDTAQQLSKEVAIDLIGEETELDKTVLEKINDPLVHLIRNSVDHGIENADIRISRGKPAKGTVTLAAFHQSGKLVLEVKDDGGGLDPEKLKKKAIEKGIIKADANLSEREAFSLIFAPGFSTKELVTDVSGRGVGMDVVRTNIAELGGEIQTESQLGIGTTFRVILPLTLAIIESMVTTYSNEKFVIPLNHVFETLNASPSMVQKNSNLGDILMLRGENLPLIRLGDFFGLKSDKPAEEMIAMVIKSGRQPFAILVDDILGQYQVVIKQLGPELQGIKGISGSTILGDGKPALIIEPHDLLKRKVTKGYIEPKPRAAHEVGGNAA